MITVIIRVERMVVHNNGGKTNETINNINQRNNNNGDEDAHGPPCLGCSSEHRSPKQGGAYVRLLPTPQADPPGFRKFRG